MIKRLKGIYESMLSNDLRVLPANLAYSFTLAIIPILSLVLYFLSTLSLPASIVEEFLEKNVPHSLVDLLAPIFTTSITASSFITICVGIIVAANGCNAIIIASNTVYNMENSIIYKRFTKAMFLMVIIIVLFAFILIVPLFGKSIVNFLIKSVPLFSDNVRTVNIMFNILRVPVSLFIIFFILKLIYTIAPDGNIRSKYVNEGSLFTTIMWLTITSIFSYYINNVARYDLVYGNLANLAILLFWFYIMAYIFVIGICINKESVEKGIEKTNKYKLDEIRKKIKEEKNKS